MRKIKPKKSWEIGDNLCGSAWPREPKTMWNDDQPLLPIHLIDGDPETAWSSRSNGQPDRNPEWIRVDLPMESTVASVTLVCSKVGPCVNGCIKVGKALPGEIAIKVSRDAKQWETVYENRSFSGPNVGPTVIELKPRPAKQIWITANKLQNVGFWGHAFSIGEIEIEDPTGSNLAVCRVEPASRCRRPTTVSAWTGSRRTCCGPSSTTWASNGPASATTWGPSFGPTWSEKKGSLQLREDRRGDSNRCLPRTG